MQVKFVVDLIRAKGQINIQLNTLSKRLRTFIERVSIPQNSLQ